MTRSVSDPRPLAAVPTLDELARDAALAETLPRSALADLYKQAAHLEADLRVRLALGGEHGRAGARDPQTGDELIGVKEAARMMNVSPSTVRMKLKAKTEPYRSAQVPNGTKKLSFSRRALERYIARRAGR